MWRPKTGLVTLGRPAGFTDAQAWAIDGSQIVGVLRMDEKNHAVLWENGAAIELGTMPGGNYSAALAISGGNIAGIWGNNISGPALRAFIWRNGVMEDLDLPIGPNSSASDVTGSGKVVGWMGTSSHVDSHAFIWQDGVATDLGVIPGGLTASALAVNTRTQCR